jgi:hypothetical protein
LEANGGGDYADGQLKAAEHKKEIKMARDGTVQRSRHRTWTLWAVGMVVTALVLTATGRPGEAPVYEKAAQRLIAGEPIYRPDDPPAFTYPPFFALIYVPLLALPQSTRLFAWNALNVTLLLSILAVLFDLARPWLRSLPAPARRMRIGAGIALTLLAARFLISPLEYRSHDYWVLLSVLVSARMLVAGRDGWGGVLAGLAAAMKATPLLLVVVFVVQRRWRAVATMALSLAVATALPDWITPSVDGQSWSRAWYENFVSKVDVGEAPDAPGAWASWNALNQSLSGTLYRLFTQVPRAEHQWDISLIELEPAQLRWLTLGLQLTILLGLAWAVSPPRANDTDASRSCRVLGEYSLALCGMLLLSPMSSKQHFCGLVPGLVFLVGYVGWQRPSRVAIAALVVVFAVGTLGAKDLIGAAARTQLQAYGSVTLCTVALFVAIMLILRREAHTVIVGSTRLQLRAALGVS